MLTAEQITLINQILSQKHDLMIAELYGADVLTSEERASLEAAGIDVDKIAGDMLLDAYSWVVFKLSTLISLSALPVQIYLA